MLDNLLRIAGLLSLGGLTVAAAVAGAFQLFRWLGAKWLDAKFAERLADYQHRQNQEIENLRAKIAALLDRAMKLHHHEFEVLPTAWKKLSASIGSASDVLSLFQRGSDLGAMHPEQLEKVLESSKLLEFEKQQVRDADRWKKGHIFLGFDHNHRYVDAWEKWRELHNYVIAEGVFIQPAIRKKLTAISLLINEALDEHQFLKSDNAKTTELRVNSDKVSVTASAMRDEIDAMISARLWDAVEVAERLPSQELEVSSTDDRS